MKTVRIRGAIKAFLSDGPKNTMEILKHLNSKRLNTTSQQLGNTLSKDKDIVKLGYIKGRGILSGGYGICEWAVNDWVQKNVEGWKEGAGVLLDVPYSPRPIIWGGKMNVDTCVIGVSNQIMFSPLMHDLNFYNKNGKKIEHDEWMKSDVSRFHPAIRSIVNLNFRENPNFPDFSIGAELELRQTAKESKMVRLHLSPFDVSYYFEEYLRKELTIPEVNVKDSKGDHLDVIVRPKSVPVPAFQIEPLEDSIIDGQGMDIIGRIGLSGGSIELPKWFCNLSKRFVKSGFQHSWSIDNIEISKIEAIWGVRRAARDVPAIWVEELNNIGESDFALLNWRIGLKKSEIDIRWNRFIQGEYGQMTTDEMARRMEKLNGRKGELRINNTTGLLMTQIESSFSEKKLLREEGLLKGTYLVLRIMLIQSKSLPRSSKASSTDVKSANLRRLPRLDFSEIGLSPKTLSPEQNPVLYAPLSSFIGWSISHLSRLKNDEEVEYLTKDLLSIVRKVMIGFEWDRRNNREGMIRLSEEISSSPSRIAETQLTLDDLFQDSDWTNISSFSELLDVVAESILFAMIYLSKYDEYLNEIRINDSITAVELLRMIISPMELIDAKGQIVGYSPNRRSILSRELTDIFLHGFCFNIEMESSQDESEIFFNRYSLIKSVNSSNSQISKN